MKKKLLDAIKQHQQLGGMSVRTAAIYFPDLRALLLGLPSQELTVRANLRFI